MHRSPQRSGPRVVSSVGVPWIALIAVIVATTLARAQATVEKPAAPDPAAAKAAELDKKLITAAKEGSEVMANLTYLSDVIGPRLTGSTNLKRANEWTAEKMKNYGLSNVRLEAWTLPVGWERGTAYARLIEPDNGRSLVVAAMGWSPGTKGKVEGDVVIIKARNSEELKAYKGKLKNAIILRGQPANVRPLTELLTPGGRPTTGAPVPDGQQPFPMRPAGGFGEMQQFRRELSEFLRSEGAAAILNDAGKPHGLLTMTGGWQGQDRASASDPLPSLTVAHEHYALLYRLASRPAPARTRVELEVTNKTIPGPIAVHNTIGEIIGSEKPDEFVIVGAHLDSWDLGQGTTDNGTGSSVVLETARILAKCGVQPKRTIRFVLFTGEEQGLHGSRAYVEKHKDELPKTSVCVVHDTGTGKVTGVGLGSREVLKPIFDKELTTLKELGVADYTGRSFGGSDHASFERANVPGFLLKQDPAEYRFTHHSQSDTLDKAREPDLIQGVQVMAIIAMRCANRDGLLPREKKEERRPGGGGPPQ